MIPTEGEAASIVYHDIFDYPLSFTELIRWSEGGGILVTGDQCLVVSKNGHYFLEGREALIYKKFLRKRISDKKLEIAKRASKIISNIASIKMVAVTGSLAMKNSTEEGDIDLFIITKKGTMWTSRLITLITLIILRIPIRKFGDKNQKDKLCLNMWFDESDLIFRDRNHYTAHEIAQIIPLVNKDKTYERFLYKNKWILNFWPNAIKVTEKLKDLKTKKFFSFSVFKFFSSFVERLAFKMQYFYMKSKITREVITPTRALFHPQDWGRLVLSRLTP